MKKLFIALSLAAFALGAQAQQLPNVGFESWKDSGNAGFTYQSSKAGITGSTNGGLRQRPGDEPTDWMGSSINQKVMNMEKQEVLIFKKGSSSNYYAELVNKWVGVNLGLTSIGSVAPGYLTFGTPWVYAVSDISKCDGGTYGSKEFTYKPDYIRGKFKKTAVGTAEPSYIIAYVWNGTFTSQIASTSTNDNDRLKDDVERAILGSVSETGVTAPSRVTQSGKLIAWCNYAFKNTTTSDSDWETISVPLNYVAGNITETPSKMNVIISGGDYWTRGNLQDGTTLDVDDVEFVYNSQLQSLSVDGVSVSGFNKDTYNYIIDDFYVDGTTNVAWQDNTFAGVATVNGTYDPLLCKYIIIVKGQDYSVNPSNSHTYTIQFKDAALSDISYDGVTLPDFSETKTGYDLSSLLYDESKLGYTVKGSSATVIKSYNEETGILTITVTSTITGLVTEYTVQFNVLSGPQVESTKIYSEPLYVTINGETGEKQITEVVVETLDNDNINFVLKNFMLGEGDEATPVGNIAVNNIAVASDGSFAFDEGIVIEAGDDPELFWYGPYLGNVPLDLNGRFLDENHIAVAIDIDMTSTLEQMINVHLGYARATMAVTEAQYGTFCAPYAVEVPDGVQAFTVPSVADNNVLDLTEVVGTIPANTPVVLFAEAGLETVESFGVAEAGTPTVGLLTGVYENTSAPVGSYVLQNNVLVGFYQVAEGGQPTVGANRCYLTTSSGIKAFFFDEDDATAIKAIDNAQQTAEGAIYNLAGQRMSKMQKGINIINGKKVLK